MKMPACLLFRHAGTTGSGQSLIRCNPVKTRACSVLSVVPTEVLEDYFHGLHQRGGELTAMWRPALDKAR